jgi:hypothetical protein
MRLVFHPKTYSDIDTIMAYYEQAATPDLLTSFMPSYGIFLRRRLKDLNPFRFESTTFAE